MVAPGAPRGAKMELKWEQKLRKNLPRNQDWKNKKNSIIDQKRLHFCMIFGAAVVEHTPWRGCQPKRATSSSYCKNHYFLMKILVRDGRPKKFVWWICDGNVIENRASNKKGRRTEKGRKKGRFWDHFWSKMWYKMRWKTNREKGGARKAPFLRKRVAPGGHAHLWPDYFGAPWPTGG